MAPAGVFPDDATPMLPFWATRRFRITALIFLVGIPLILLT